MCRSTKSGSYTAAAGCAIYEGGAWPAKWNYGYFTTEPTLNIVSHFMVEPEGVTYKAKREPGREQTEFIRSKNLWFRPIEVRVGPDGALYVVDFCNQAVIHNDTRGPTHGPANAAVRPDRESLLRPDLEGAAQGGEGQLLPNRKPPLPKAALR